MISMTNEPRISLPSGMSWRKLGLGVEFGEMLSFLETAQSACQAGWFALILIIGMLSLANEYWR